MGILDVLINKNKEPKKGLEYIYLMDMMWEIGKLGNIPCEKGTIVTDVVKLQNDSFEFVVKESGKRFKTTYGFALAENTPENVERIKDYRECISRFNEIEKEMSNLRSKVVDLDGPSKL